MQCGLHPSPGAWTLTGKELKMSPEPFHAIGIDIGGTKIAAGLVSFPEGRILSRKILPTGPNRGEQAILDGRVFFGMTEYDGKVAFRPAAVNWRNRPEDVDLIVDVVRELGARFS